jgi:acetyltransferase-like isoleucine patch superfamily enzyme
MNKIRASISHLFKFVKLIRHFILRPFDQSITILIIYLNGVTFKKIKTYGIPKINVSVKGKMQIGNHFEMNNRNYVNPIGRLNPCSFSVSPNATLVIGNNVGMSSTTIVCHKKIEIGDNVKIGANVVIYDTDFHSLNPKDRLNIKLDKQNTHRKSVKIYNNVFIGAHSTILKGVEIGENSIIGACSVVTKSVPENEIWAGNPAKFLKKLELSKQ